MNEFELIQAYFTSLAAKCSGGGVVLGIGDDCAILQPPPNAQLVVSTDTLISGVHFPENTTAYDVGFKALAVNLSDLAAMGADPLWFTLCITLPESTEAWLEGFCEGLAALAIETGISLVGGDTTRATRGPLSISIHVTGAVDIGKAITRSGALVGDDIYVSGMIGQGAAGLALALADDVAPEGEDLQEALQQFNCPEPRLKLGKQLIGIANSCIDISDGLFADLQHILTASEVGASIDVELIPMSPAIMESSLFFEKSTDEKLMLACNGGDDYELCFTAPVTERSSIAKLSTMRKLPLTRIGKVVAGKGIKNSISSEEIAASGYQHF